MSQHYLLSSKARNLSILKIATMSDKEAFEMFKTIRWNQTNGEPVCPCCGSVKKHYFLKTRFQYRCKECFHTFSVTSGTLFASHKKPLQIYLLAIALFTNAVKSISALQLPRDLDVQYKTACVLYLIKSENHLWIITVMKSLRERVKWTGYMLMVM